jgi:hypothetical protein
MMTRRMIWAGHAARMGRIENHYQNQDVGGSIIFKMDFRETRMSGMNWTDLA